MDYLSESAWEKWKNAVGELLALNRVDSNGRRYTRPAPSIYEHQWLWDSCFHALANRWIDPEMAGDELLSLVAHQVQSGPDEGMVPHMAYWKGGADELWHLPDRSFISMIPLIAAAAWRVYRVSHERSLLVDLYPRLAAFHEWFERRRDPDGDHLVSIIHPWEAGSDASPRWDAPLGLHNPTYQQAKDARFALVRVIEKFECNALELGKAGYFHLETLDFNAARAADLEDLGKIALELGKPGEAARWQQEAAEVQTAVSAKMLTPRPHELSGIEETPIWQESGSSFIALYGGCATPEQAGALIATLKAPRYFTPYPVSTTPTDDPLFEPTLYWRGNVWPSVNWLIYTGLRRYGETALAGEIARRQLEMEEKSGFYEFFHPITGQGLGANHQSWDAIVLDMLATERGMATD